MDQFSKEELRDLILTACEAQQEAAEIQQLKRMQHAPTMPTVVSPSFAQRMAYSQSFRVVLHALEVVAVGAIAVRLWWF